MYRQSEKNLLNSNISPTCPYNVVNFGPLTADICWRVWGTPANFNGFRILAALLHGTVVVGVSQTAALNRGRHLYSAGRPSRWALAHILVVTVIKLRLSTCFYIPLDTKWVISETFFPAVLEKLNLTQEKQTLNWNTKILQHKTSTTRMWASAKRDGRPAEYRWRPLFNAAKFG